MPKTTFLKPEIKGLSAVIGGHKKSIKDEIDFYAGNIKNIERIQKTIGLNERYIVEGNTTSTDLCEVAAISLIDEMGLDRGTIDGLVMVTQTPDYVQPASSAYLHGKLELNENCAVFDVNLGCSGYVYGLWLAFMMVETGTCRHVLLLAGDTMSRCVNLRDRSIAPLFGDAGTATLIGSGTQDDNKSFFSLNTNGKGYKHLIIPAGGFREPRNEANAVAEVDGNGNYRSRQDLYMNGAEIFNFSIKTEPKAIQEILQYSKIELKNIDYIVFHQANKYIISNIIRRLNVPACKVPMETVSRYGNQSSASIPVTIIDALKNEIASKSKTVILSGFGVGLSWASCITNLTHVICTNIQTYENKEGKNE